MSKASSQDVASLCGLGPRSREMLARIGVHSAQDLQGADAFALFARLKQVESGLSLNMLYALIGAQEGRHWQDIQRERRTEILLRLDDMGLAPGRRRRTPAKD